MSEPPRTLVRIATALLVFSAIAAAAVFAIGVSSFRATARTDWIIMYLVLPAATAVGFAISLRSSPPARVNTAIALVSTGLALYGLELSIVYWDWPNYLLRAPDRPAGAQIETTVDTRSTSAIRRDLQRHGQRTHPLASGPFILAAATADLQPLGGASGVATVACSEGGYALVFRSDEYGFHNPDGMWASVGRRGRR